MFCVESQQLCELKLNIDVRLIFAHQYVKRGRNSSSKIFKIKIIENTEIGKRYL